MKSPSPHHSAAEEQAALWAARLEGASLSAADRDALDAWLAEADAHRALLASYCQFSADLEQQLPALVAAGAVSMSAKKVSAASRWNLRWLLGGALATAALAAFAVWFGAFRPTSEDFAAPAGHRETFTLADGTRVELNAHTRLLVAHTRAERRVRLLEGEAFFTVSKNPARPFFVETTAGTVRVTGTIFDVHCETAAALEVTVAEGSVQVQPAVAGGGKAAAAPVALGAGDRLIATATRVAVEKLSADALDDALAWREGQIVCEGMPLREALARFSRYHGRLFTATPAAGEKLLGGRYSFDDPDTFLTGIARALPVRVTRESGGNVQVSLVGER